MGFLVGHVILCSPETQLGVDSSLNLNLGVFITTPMWASQQEQLKMDMIAGKKRKVFVLGLWIHALFQLMGSNFS
jgi:hypothetical protein